MGQKAEGALYFIAAIFINFGGIFLHFLKVSIPHPHHSHYTGLLATK